MGSGSKKVPSYSSAAAISPATEAAASSDVLLAGEVGQSVEAMEAGAYGHDPEGYEKFQADLLLAAWLHPLYSAESKGEIQQAALKRFFELADKSAILDKETTLAQSLGIPVSASPAPAWDLPRF